MQRLAAVLPALLAALVAVQGAAAHSRTVGDPANDFKGSGWPGSAFIWDAQQGCWVDRQARACDTNDYFEDAGALLDIRSIQHGHGGQLLTHRISFARTVSSSTLSGSRGGQVSFYFSTDRDAAFERRLDVLPRGRGLTAVMRDSAGRSVGTATVTRPNARTIQVAFPRSLLGRGVRAYRWFAFAGIDCQRRYDDCGDRAPRGLLVH